jgi:hypothetical protein
MFTTWRGKRAAFLAQDALRGDIRLGGGGRAGQFVGRPGSSDVSGNFAAPARVSVTPVGVSVMPVGVSVMPASPFVRVRVMPEMRPELGKHEKYSVENGLDQN